jgi:hypothetical protein
MTAPKLTSGRIADLRKLADAATPGKLVFRGKDSTIRHPGEPPYEFGSEVVARFTEDDNGRAEVSDGDLDLWLVAGESVPQLLEHVAALEKELDRYKEALEKIANQDCANPYRVARRALGEGDGR